MPAAAAHSSPPPARKGRANRVRLGGGGPWVDKTTLAQLNRWRKHASHGLLVDRLVAHAKRTNFNPGTDCL